MSLSLSLSLAGCLVSVSRVPREWMRITEKHTLQCHKDKLQDDPSAASLEGRPAKLPAILKHVISETAWQACVALPMDAVTSIFSVSLSRPMQSKPILPDCKQSQPLGYLDLRQIASLPSSALRARMKTRSFCSETGLGK